MSVSKFFPDFFPEALYDKLISLGAKEQKLEVYRICKFGQIDADGFLSTFEETKRQLRPEPREGLNLDDVATFSTSCHMDLKDSKKMLKIFLRHHPTPIISKGSIKPQTGLSQITKERDPERKDSHVDWWIYADVTPYVDFKQVNDDE